MKYFIIVLFIIYSPIINADNSNLKCIQEKIGHLISEIETEENDSVKIEKIIQLVDLQPDNSNKKLEYICKGLEIAKSCNWNKGIGLCHYYMAWYHFLRSDEEQAKTNFYKVIEYSNEADELVNSYGFLSNIFSWNKEHEKALEYANIALKLSFDKGTIQETASSYIFLGDAYRYAGFRNEANENYFKAEYLLKNDTSIVYSLSQLSYLYTLNGYVDSPFYLLKFAQNMKAAYDNSSVVNKQIYLISLIKFATAYNTSAKNELKKEIELEHKKKQTYIYISGISLLILMLGVLIYQNILKRRTNQELRLANNKLAEINSELDNANKTKSRFLAILNHDLRRPIAGLISYLELKKKKSDIIDKNQEKAFEQETIDTTQKLLEDMENLLFWCKSQMENFSPVLKTISILKLFEDTADFFQYEKNIKNTYYIKDDICLITDENYLKTILRNLTLNAIEVLKKTENARIEWKAFQEDNSTIIAISNNGPIIPQEKINLLYENSEISNIKNGLGLIIVKDLAKAINCKIEVKKDSIIGTTFFLIFSNK